MVSAEITSLRALNYLRATHLPSYVALRCLMQTTAPGRFESILETIVTQATIRRHPRVLNLRRFKALENDRYIYRSYFVPAPSAALADAYALGVLHNTQVVKRYSDVFSYRPPPSPSYRRNYEHFSSGYKERNHAVATALVDNELVAVVTDIKSFYPSISANVAVNSLMSRCSALGVISGRDLAIVQACAERSALLEGEGGGLGIGMEMSHALANQYLLDADHILRNHFPSRYFRYVDDIVLVVKRSEVRSALSFLDETLANLGLERNPDKDCISDRSEWSLFEMIGKRSSNESGDCLANLKFRIKLFLARNPDSLVDLREGLQSGNVHLPLDQLMQGASELSWRLRVSDFLRRGWKVLLRYRFDSLGDVLAAAFECRSEVLGVLSRNLENGVAEEIGLVARRWRIQALRFSINRAFYFADDPMLRRIASFAGVIPELAETRAVCEALVGDCTRLVHMPGPAVAATTQLMALRGLKASANFESLSLFAGLDMSADLEAHLGLRELGSFSTDVSNRDTDLLALIGLARRQRFRRVEDQFGYGSEVQALAANFSSNQLSEMARTRFLSQEDVVLDALSLDSAYGS